MHSWNFGLFFFENAFMNALLFFECIYNVYNVCMYVWIFFFIRKCIHEILDFFFLKMHLWMHDFFLNAYIMYIMYVLMIFFYGKIHLWRRDFFFLFENAFMNAWFFLNAYNFFFLECIYKWNFWECIYNVQNVRKNILNILWMHI